MLAVISAGKTSILKVLFNINFLISSSGIGTKFVNIIRYNPEVGNNPKFYHLFLRKNENNDYEYYKDESSEIIGKSQIKERNIQLNDKFKNKEVPYNNLFYMVEVGESYFLDKEYLKNYDLVDIPGVSEYISSNNNIKSNNYTSTIEQEMKQFNIDEEKSYLTEIFKIIKNKIKNGIIVFSIDNYTHVENYRIIGKFQKVIDKPIENFLILLNKIDKSENKEEDINKLYSKIIEYFPSLKKFNFTKNTLLPCSSIQLKNELKMETSFYHLIYFHFLNFLMDSKQNKDKYKNTNFIDFIIKFLNRDNITKKRFINQINEFRKNKNFVNILYEIKNIFKNIKKSHLDENLNFGLKEDDFKENEIINSLQNIEEDEEDNDDTKINLNELNGNIIILYYYLEFKNNNKKLIPQKSLDTLKLMRYFNQENVNSKNEYLPYNISDPSEMIYIPLLGLSNAGKSTILNGLIGINILPAQKKECTKKGILIRYWKNDYPIMRKLRFINYNNKYYLEPEKEIIGNNLEDIKNILNGLNGKFIENEQDFFYEIDINIKFIKEAKIEERLKERICFIDLPGFGTNNKFEYLDTYSHLINMSDIFIYVVFNQKIKENDNNKMLNKIYNNIIQEKRFDDKEFIKRCLFIINFDKDQDTSIKSILQAKDDILKILKNLNNSYINDLNLCFYNAKFYENYLLKYNYYNSFSNLIKNEINQFIKLKELFNKGEIENFKGGPFNKYFLNKLKENIRNDVPVKFNENIIELDKELKKEINDEIQKYNFIINEKEINLIIKYISFARMNLNKNDLLEKSNFELIKKNLILILKNIKLKKIKKVNRHFNKSNKRHIKKYNSYIRTLNSSKEYIEANFRFENSNTNLISLTEENYISNNNNYYQNKKKLKYNNDIEINRKELTFQNEENDENLIEKGNTKYRKSQIKKKVKLVQKKEEYINKSEEQFHKKNVLISNYKEEEWEKEKKEEEKEEEEKDVVGEEEKEEDDMEKEEDEEDDKEKEEDEEEYLYIKNFTKQRNYIKTKKFHFNNKYKEKYKQKLNKPNMINLMILTKMKKNK